MVYFHNRVARITLHSGADYLHLHWGPDLHTDTALQQVMEQVLVALQTHRWQKLLVSQEAEHPFSVELQVWLQLDWRPRAVQAGYRYCALVQPPDLLSQMALVDILETQVALWPRYYASASEEEARTWLRTQPHIA
jgi:hypothetical protein